MKTERVIRSLEFLGIIILIVSLFLPYRYGPVFTGGGNLISGGYYFGTVTLLNFILNSSLGVLIATVLIALGALMVIARAGGQILVITGSTSLILITLEQSKYFPSGFDVAVVGLIIGSTLCSSRFVADQVRDLKKV